MMFYDTVSMLRDIALALCDNIAKVAHSVVRVVLSSLAVT